MPGPLRSTNSRAEAKYNVTTDFPNLGLHAAAATGNVGLVEYALSHGQPINSVLDGVLPLHAACSGGDDLVVRKLIEYGADVNAPRLPRRYSNDKNRDASAPIVGTSGSTPLHFAAANGNTKVISTLLLYGAHANRPDKHGVTPEALARQNGWLDCADLLRDWVRNKDRDLREREHRSEDPAHDPDHSSRRRVHVKHSIDNALNILKSKSSSSALSDAYLRPPHSSPPSGQRDRSPPSPVSKPFGEYTFYETASPTSEEIAAERRPSLPHIYTSPTRNRYPSVTAPPSNARRPRSAGTDAEPASPPSGSSPRHGPRKLGSKYSLMNLFKKGLGEESALSTSPPATLVSSASDSAPVRPTARHRMGSDSAIRPPISSRPSVVDLHNVLAADDNASHDLPRHRRPSSPPARPSILRSGDNRARSGSRGSSGIASGLDSGSYNRGGAVFDDDMVVPGVERPPARPVPSILRAHNRSSSGGVPGSPGRSLRFDSSSSVGKRRQGSDTSPALRSSASASSLVLSSELVESTPPTPATPAVPAVFDEEDEEYGVPLPEVAQTLQKSPLTDLRTRDRGASFASSVSSFSADATLLLPTTTEFPFSIHHPPDANLTVPTPGRGRGDSVSSTGSTGSAGPALSTSGSTSGGGSAAVATPASSPASLPASPRAKGRDIDNDDTEPGVRVRRHTPVPLTLAPSSSARTEAEALVARATQSILEMGDASDGTLDGMPLTAKLAALGKSLALARRLREETASAPAEQELTTFTREPAPGALRGLDRQRSLGHAPRAGRTPEPQRPSTSGGTPSTRSDDAPLIDSPPRTAASRGHTPSRSTPMALGAPRSRTPDPLGMDDTDKELALCRVSTAPVPAPARARVTASKLTRMGISPLPPPAARDMRPRFGLRSLMQSLRGRA